jgi:hypothetical protein
VDTPKQAIEELEHAPPGERFQRLYRKRQRSPHRRLKNGLFLVGGLAIIAVGIATEPIPVVPSEIVILLGLALLAGGSRWGAKGLDKLELWFRAHFGGLIRWWNRLPKWARIALSLAWVALVSGGSYFAYRALT